MDLEKSKLSLKSSDLDLKNGHNVVAVIEWHNEAGEVVEGTLPETTKLKVNGVDTTYTTEEKGNTSELTFTCDSVDTHEITVDGLGEGVPALGPVTLTVVDTTPVVDLEKTMVSIDPETYDIEDRDNTVVRFDWKDQFGNPITNTLPESVKLTLNDSTITVNPKENGNNTEVVIKSTVVKSHEIVVTGLNSKDTKLTFSVTDRRLGKVAQSKTSVGYFPEVVNLYENNKVAAQFFMKDYKDNELTLPITVKAFIDGVEAEVVDIGMDDKIRTYQITVNPVTEEKDQVLSLEISYDEDGETKSFKTNSKSIKVIPRPEGIVVEPYLTGFGEYYRDVDTDINGWIVTKDGDDNKLPTEAGIWKYYANDVEITKVVETPPTGVTKDLSFEINFADNLDVIKDGLVDFKITNLDDEVIFTEKVSIYPLKSMEMDNLTSRSYLMGDRYTILENGEAHCHFLLEPRNKEGELVPYYGDDITVMDFNSISVIPHGDITVDGDGKYIVPLTFTEPVDLQLVIAINGGTVSDGTVMDAEFRGEAITILTQEGYDELLKEVDNSRTVIEVITKEHPLINEQARVELEVTVKNIEDRDVDVNVDHFKVYEGETLIDSINTSTSTGKLTMTFYSSELGDHTYTVKYNDVKSGNEVTVDVIEATVDISLTQMSLVREVVDMKDYVFNNTLLIKWFLDELTPIENTLPEGVTFTINDEVLEVNVIEQGTSSKVDFIVPDSPGNYDLMVNGLDGELGEIKFGPYSFEVVDTTPVVDLEKTVVSINPETYDVEDRDNSVLKFEWKDQFGNPITNALPEDVKISMNGSDIVPNAKENGDNTEVTIKSTVANTYEIVVTGLKTSEVKVSFTVTDVRSGVLDPTKTAFTLTSTEHELKDGKVNVVFNTTVKDFYNKPVTVDTKDFTIKSNGVLVPSTNESKATGNVNLTIEVTQDGEHTYELFYKDVKQASDINVTVTPEPILVDVSKTKVTLEKTSVDLKVSDDNSLLLEWFGSDSNPIVNTLPGGVSFTIDGTPLETTTTENGISTNVSFKVPSTVGKKSITIKGLGDSDFGPYEFDIVDTTPVFDASKSTWSVVETSNGEFEGNLDAKDQFGDTFSVDSESAKLSVNGEEVEFSNIPLSNPLTTFYFRYETPGTHVVSLDVLGTKLTPDKEITVLDLSPKVSIKDTKATISTNQLDLATSDKVTVTLDWVDQFGNPIEHNAPSDILIKLNDDIIDPVKDESGLTNTKYVLTLTTPGIYYIKLSGLVDPETSEEINFDEFPLIVTDSSLVFDPNTSTWELIDNSDGDGESLTCIITCKDRNGDLVITPSSQFVVKVDGVEIEALPKHDNVSVVELSFDYSVPGLHEVTILVAGEILEPTREFTTIDRSPRLDPTQTTWSIDPVKINVNETDTFTVTINPKDQYGSDFFVSSDEVLLSIGEDILETEVVSDGDGVIVLTFKKVDLGTFSVDLNLLDEDILPSVSIEIVDIIDGSVIEPSFDINKSSWKLTKPKANISGEMTIALTVDSRNKGGGKTGQPWSLYYQIEGGALVQLDSKDKPNGTEYVIDVSDYPELGFYSIALFVLGEKFGESQEFEVVNINDGGEVEEPSEGCDCENRDRPYGGNPIDELLEERFESIICCRDSYPDKMEL